MDEAYAWNLLKQENFRFTLSIFGSVCQGGTRLAASGQCHFLCKIIYQVKYIVTYTAPCQLTLCPKLLTLGLRGCRLFENLPQLLMSLLLGSHEGK